MTWIPLLLADPSPCLRRLVLSELLDRPATDPEVLELLAAGESDQLAAGLLASQAVDGSWPPGLRSELGQGDAILPTARALSRLGYLGFPAQFPAIRRAAEYLFSRQQADGAWPLIHTGGDTESEGYSMMPLQTCLPLRGLAACGYAADPRSERAYGWLLAQRLPDGAWPTGIASGNYGYVAGYRRLPHSRWGCRSNTTAALICLASHPERRSSPDTRRALDLLLGRETKESYAVGFDVARLIGAEPSRGFITTYARFDLAQILDLCWRVGVPLEDARLADIVAFVRRQQGAYGLWEYPRRPQASRWVTFDLLRSLSRLDQSGDWVSLEPRTPFQPYPAAAQRF
jgi:hypothetical protein